MQTLRMLAAALALGMSAIPASAVVVAQAKESGGNVVITATGSYDVSGLTLENEDIAFLINPSAIGPATGDMLFVTSTADTYSGLLSVPTLGLTSGTLADVVTGDTFGYSAGRLFLGANASLTGSISSTMTFSGESFASLGLSTGTYEWLWSTDSIVLTVGRLLPPVPLPAGLPLLAAAFGTLAFARFRRLR